MRKIAFLLKKFENPSSDAFIQKSILTKNLGEEHFAVFYGKAKLRWLSANRSKHW